MGNEDVVDAGKADIHLSQSDLRPLTAVHQKKPPKQVHCLSGRIFFRGRNRGATAQNGDFKGHSPQTLLTGSLSF